jgi:predicted MFS family arabinose efflux permease
VLGPLIGGALVELIGWRAIFLFNLALGLPILALATRFLRDSRDPEARPIDVRGVAALCVGLVLVVFAILRGNELGWASAPIVTCFAVGAVVLVGFVAIERVAPAPMLDMALFANPTFTGATLAVAVLGAATFGALAYLSLFLMQGQDRGPVEAGLVLAPQAATSFAVAVVAGRFLNDRLPLREALTGGLVLLAAGLWMLRGLEPDGSWTHLLPGLLVLGIGTGLVNPMSTVAHLGVVPASQGGLAAAVNNMARQLGVLVGLAALGALVGASLRTAGGPPGTPQYADTFSSALDDMWMVGAVANLLAAAAAALLVRQRDVRAVGGVR